MSNIILPRTIGENILLSKHDIKILPFYEDFNSKSLDIEHDDGLKQLRTLKSNPVGYDFSCNIINDLIKAGHEFKIDYIDGVEYYFSWVTEDYIIKYLAQSRYENRRALKNALETDFTRSFVVVKTTENNFGKTILRIPPFRIVKIIDREGHFIFRYAWAKCIFESLVTGDCTKQGGDGYITVPEKFFPLATRATKAADEINKISNDEKKGRTHLLSANPIYKLEIYAKMKNTNGRPSVTVSREELLKTIAPEVIDKNGYLKNIKNSELHDILVKEILELKNELPADKNILTNFYLGNQKQNESILYFERLKKDENK